jgi:hypothetical protein
LRHIFESIFTGFRFCHSSFCLFNPNPQKRSFSATLNEQTPASTWQSTYIRATRTHLQLNKDVFMRAISPLFPSNPTSHHVLETAKHIQLETDFTEQVSEIAFGYRRQVAQIFPAQELVLFLLTASARRHVWFAVLAQMNEISDPLDLQRDLLTASSKDLIKNAYGSVPSGFLTVLAKLPAKAKARRFYKELHKLLTNAPALAASLANNALDENIIELLNALPPEYQTFKVANAFGTKENYQKFKLICDAFASEQPDFLNTSLAAIKNKTSLERIFYRLYESIAFAKAALPHHDRLTYIHNGQVLRKLAQSWENCLGQYLEEAIRNEVQYYVFTTEAGDELIFGMKNDHPFGWYLSEVKNKNNDSPDLEQLLELEDLLKELGFGRTESANYMMKSLVADCERTRRRRERENYKATQFPTKFVK